ncbi:MAG TPA: alpha/beta hydrolase family protein, partial [Bryobacteraceae bacterium]|nr:alpha/beta hydrolase family protein [Bryobacteraceae bacterium]
NLKRYAAVRANRPAFSLAKVRETAGFNPATGPLNIATYGTLQRSGYRIEKLTYESEQGILIPAVLYIPENHDAKSPAIIYADGEGKQAVLEAAELLVKKGNIVLAIDARGLGETRPVLDERDHFFRYFADYENAETAILLGKSLVGMRAADIARGVDVLTARADVDGANISGFGRRSAATAMLHAAALDPRIKKLVLEGMLLSYDAIVTHRIHRQMFEQIVPSALKFYDLPDLANSFAPRPISIINAVNPLGQVLSAPEVHAVYSKAQVYATRGPGRDEPVNPVLEEIFK